MRKSKQIIILTSLVFSFLCFPIKQVFASENMAETPLTVKQKFIVDNAAAEMDFIGNYEMCALDKEAPMPENAKDGVYAFSLNGEQAQTTILMQYLHAGVYHYQLKQTTTDKEYYEYDKSCYDITVYVKNGEDGKLIPQVVAEKGDGKKAGELEFQNSYHGKKSDPSILLKPDETVKTGDITHVMTYVFVAAGALLLAGTLVRIRKNNQKAQ